MKKKYITAAFLILLGISSLRAQYNLKLYNTLTREMQSAKSGSQKIKAMLALGDYHVEQSYMEGYQKSMDTAYAYAGKCESLSKTVKSKTDLGYTYLLYSKAFNYESKYDQSIEFAQKAIAIFTKKKDNIGLCYANSTLFKALRYIGNQDAGGKVTNENLEIAKKTGNKLLIGMANEDCALSTLYIGKELRKVFIFSGAAIRYYSAAGKKDLQYIYSIQAVVYSYLSEQEKALKSINIAISLAEKFGDTSYYMADLYDYAGITYRDMERSDIAIKYFRVALNIAKKYIDPQITLVIAINLYDELNDNGLAYNNRDVLAEIQKNYPKCHPSLQLRALSSLLDDAMTAKNYTSAEKYFTEIRPLLSQIDGDRAAITSSAAALTKYYFYKKQYRASKTYLDIYKNTIPKDNEDLWPFAYARQFELDSAQGNYLEAIRNYQLMYAAQNRIFNSTKHRQLNELEIRYQTAKKERDNLLLKKQAELQQSRLSQNTLIRNISLIGIALLAITSFIIYRRFIITRKLRRELSAKSDILENLLNEKDTLLEEKESLIDEKEWLLKEIHHRVKNNLQVVMSLLNTQSYFLSDETAKEAIKNSQHRIHSMSLIHKKLYQSDNIVSVNIAAYFLELIEYYKIAFTTGDNIRFDLNSEPIELDSSQAVPIGLILNEAINNALKHAFPDDRKGVITIRVENLPANRIRLFIKDNGVGFAGDITATAFSSLGMKLIRGFVGELSGTLSFSNENGFGIEIIFTNTMITPESKATGSSDGQLSA